MSGKNKHGDDVPELRRLLKEALDDLQDLIHRQANFHITLQDGLEGKHIPEVADAVFAFRDYLTGHPERPFAPILVNEGLLGGVIGLTPPIETSIAMLTALLRERDKKAADELLKAIAAKRDISGLLQKHKQALESSRKTMESAMKRLQGSLEKEFLRIPILKKRIYEIQGQIGSAEELIARLEQEQAEASAKKEERRALDLAAKKARLEEAEFTKYKNMIDKLETEIERLCTFAPKISDFHGWHNKNYSEDFGDLLTLSKTDPDLFRYFVSFYNVFAFQDQRRSNHCSKRYSSPNFSRLKAMEFIEHLCQDHLYWPLGELKVLVSRHEVALRKEFKLDESDIWQSLSSECLDGEAVVYSAFLLEFKLRAS
jgi:hypothetical protein